jgi:hypothetical protein
MSAGYFRVDGPLPESALAEPAPGTVFVRMAFDMRARALLERVPGGFVVRHEGFKRPSWVWRETEVARRAYGASEATLACRYFNSLLLSPGYQGTARVYSVAAEGE